MRTSIFVLVEVNREEMLLSTFTRNICRSTNASTASNYHGFQRLFVRSARSAARNQKRPCGMTRKERLRLLIGPAIFTGSVGGATYVTAEVKTAQTPTVTRQRRKQVYILGVVIIGLNIAVHLLWKMGSPQVLAVLEKYMISRLYMSHKLPIARTTLSMLGSTFSHKSTIHLLLNMYVLHSLVNGFENPYQLLHVYITGGLVASLASYLRAALSLTFSGGSLGASGAILALIGYVIGSYPDVSFAVALLDQIYPHSLTAQTVLWVITCIDTCGLLFGWRRFDHAAHLAGIWWGWLRSHLK